MTMAPKLVVAVAGTTSDAPATERWSIMALGRHVPAVLHDQDEVAEQILSMENYDQQ